MTRYKNYEEKFRIYRIDFIASWNSKQHCKTRRSVIIPFGLRGVVQWSLAERWRIGWGHKTLIVDTRSFEWWCWLLGLGLRYFVMIQSVKVPFPTAESLSWYWGGFRSTESSNIKHRCPLTGLILWDNTAAACGRHHDGKWINCHYRAHFGDRPSI